MNFSKLLAAGKSMIGMRDVQTPYRMRTENLLPKFESPKNPFATTTRAGQATVAVSAPMESPIAVTAAALPILEPKPGVMETSFLFDEQLQPVVVPVAVKEAKPAVAVVAAPRKVEKLIIPVTLNTKIETPELKPAVKSEPVAAPAEAPAGSWMKRVKSILPAREERKPARARAAVQTELSLERVKVIRNDLNDTDLEVIPAKTVGKPESPAPRLQPAASTEETTFGRLTSRFFGAGQIQH